MLLFPSPVSIYNVRMEGTERKMGSTRGWSRAAGGCVGGLEYQDPMEANAVGSTQPSRKGRAALPAGISGAK